MYAQPNYFKIMNQNQLMYQEELVQQQHQHQQVQTQGQRSGPGIIPKKKWGSSNPSGNNNNSNNNSSNSNSNTAGTGNTGGMLGPGAGAAGKTHVYYPAQAQSFYISGHSAQQQQQQQPGFGNTDITCVGIDSGVPIVSGKSNAATASYDPYKFDVSKLSSGAASMGSSCSSGSVIVDVSKEFPLFFNTTVHEYIEARKERHQLRLKMLDQTEELLEPASDSKEETTEVREAADKTTVATTNASETTSSTKEKKPVQKPKGSAKLDVTEAPAEKSGGTATTTTTTATEKHLVKKQEDRHDDTVTKNKKTTKEIDHNIKRKEREKETRHTKKGEDDTKKQLQPTTSQTSVPSTAASGSSSSSGTVSTASPLTPTAPASQTTDTSPLPTLASSPETTTASTKSSSLAPTSLPSTALASTTGTTGPTTPQTPVKPEVKSWSAVASSAISKGKLSSITKAVSPALSSSLVSTQQRLKRDKKYTPPTTKGAEPIGSIALRICFDSDYVDYILKKNLADPELAQMLPVRSIIPRGIVNSANICFMSSVLQVLLYIKPFVDMLNVLSTRNVHSRIGFSLTKLIDACIQFYKQFDRENYEREKNKEKEKEKEKEKAENVEKTEKDKDKSKKDTVVPGTCSNSNRGVPSREPTPQPMSTIQASRKFNYAPSSDSITAEDFYKVLSTIPLFKDLQWGHQEDAEEFLTHMLDQLHEELISAINCLTENEIMNILHSISDETLRIHFIRNLCRYKGADFVEHASSQLNDLFAKYGTAIGDSTDENGWHEVSNSSKKGKKNRTAAKRTVEIPPTPITNIFGGQFRSVLDIPKDKESQSITLDPFQTIQLDISDPSVNDLETAFKKFSEYEFIPFRTSSGSDVKAKKQTFIDRLPQVLIIQLKRFSFVNNTNKDNSMTNYNVYSGRVEKIRKKINYGHELTIPVEVVSSLALKNSEAARHYRLIGVIYHHGVSSNGGHYTTDVYHRERKQWYRIDDINISELKFEDVLKVGESATDSRTAYILIYQKDRET